MTIVTTRNCSPIIAHSRLISERQKSYSGLLILLLLGLFTLLLQPRPLQAKTDPLVFDDTPLPEALSLPPWFKLSFLDLKEDLTEAQRKKRGLIIYFGRHDCAYCKALLESNWGRQDIVTYTRQHFDVVAIDVLGHRQITTPGGQELSEKDYAGQQKANFTPTLHFYDKLGKLAFKLTGYRPPYQFKAALEFVADRHHEHESFADYYRRAEAAEEYGYETLNRHSQIKYSDKQVNLTASIRPLLVLFDRPRCHACDVLHGGPLQNKLIMQRLHQFNALQLDITSQQSVITPAGQHTTSHAWAKQLKLDYTPTLVFFDEQGKEIIRIDSVVWFYRLSNVMDYVLTRGYRQYSTFQQWRSRHKP